MRMNITKNVAVTPALCMLELDGDAVLLSCDGCGFRCCVSGFGVHQSAPAEH